MISSRRWFSALAVTLFLFLAFDSPVAGQPAKKRKVVVHLSRYTDNLHAVEMAAHLAGAMQGMGAEVTLLLDLEGVRLVLTRGLRFSSALAAKNA